MGTSCQKFLAIFKGRSTPIGCERDLSPDEIVGMDEDSDESLWITGGMVFLLVIVPLLCYVLIH